MGFVKISFRFLPVLSICFSLCFASVGSLQAQTLEHTDTNQHEDQSTAPIAIHPTINKGQIGEQLATCRLCPDYGTGQHNGYGHS